MKINYAVYSLHTCTVDLMDHLHNNLEPIRSITVRQTFLCFKRNSQQELKYQKEASWIYFIRFTYQRQIVSEVAKLVWQ